MEPTPEELGLELEERSPASDSPEALGLELDDEPNPESLGLELEPEESNFSKVFGMTPLGLMWKGYQAVAGKVDETPIPEKQVRDDSTAYRQFKSDAVENLEDLARGTKVVAKKVKNSSLGQAAGEAYEAVDGDKILNTGISAAKTVFRPFERLFSFSDRLAGTGLGALSDALVDTNFVEKARKRDIELGLNEVDGIKKARTLPVSLGNDIASYYATEAAQGLADIMKRSDSDAVRQGAYFVEGLGKPVAGIGANIASTYFLDPIAMLKFGNLTKAGIAAEKAGGLESSVARQIAAGQRSGVSLSLPGISPISAPKPIQKLSAATVYQAQKAMADFELTKAGRALRHYTTKTGWQGADNAFENYVIEQAGREQKAVDLFDGIYSKYGIDLKTPGVMEDLYSYAAKPSSYKGRLPVERAQAIFNDLDTQLVQTVEKAKAAGLDIPKKEFESLSELSKKYGGGEKGMQKALLEYQSLDERYVPRGASPEKRAQLMASRTLKDADEAAEVVASYSDDILPGAKPTGSFLRDRNPKTREAMNAAIKEKHGIENFFHDDIVRAYVEKIDDIEQAISQKKLLDQLTAGFGRSKPEWARVIEGARGRLALAEQAGQFPHPDDLKLAKLRVGDLRGMDEVSSSAARITPDWSQVRRVQGPASQRLEKLSRFKSLKGVQDIHLPSPVADLFETMVGGTKPTQSLMDNYMRAWKNAVFFNPGFHGRNMWEAMARARSVDVSAPELAKATIAITKNKGPYDKYLKEYKTVARGLGVMSDVEDASVPLVERAQRIVATPDMMASDHPLRATQRAMSEMAAKGTLGRWLDQAKKAAAKGTSKGLSTALKPLGKDSWFVENDLYRWARQKGAAGENIPKLAYFSKLRAQGYSPEKAIRKVNKIFPNYDITRDSVRDKLKFIPFLNYSVKNAETLLSILVQNPRNAAIYAPGGAIERSLSNWAGWDADSPQRIKKLFGEDYRSDDIIMPFIPGADALEKEQDLIKKVLGTYLNWGDPNSEGKQMFLKLPTNYHALSMLDPTRVTEMTGPVVKSAIALLGVDPFTGEPFKYTKNLRSMKAAEVARGALGELGGGFVPTRAIGALRQLGQEMMPEYEEHFKNLGIPPDVIKTVMGDKQLEKTHKTMGRALDSVKLMMMGSTTRLDQDILMRIIAQAKGAQKDAKALISDVAKGKRPERDENRAMNALEHSIDEMIRLLDFHDEYEKRIQQVKPEVQMDPEVIEELEEFVPPDDAPETMEEFDDETSQLDLDNERDPASINQSIFEMGGDLTRKHLGPPRTPDPVATEEPMQVVPDREQLAEDVGRAYDLEEQGLGLLGRPEADELFNQVDSLLSPHGLVMIDNPDYNPEGGDGDDNMQRIVVTKEQADLIEKENLIRSGAPIEVDDAPDDEGREPQSQPAEVTLGGGATGGMAGAVGGAAAMGILNALQNNDEEGIISLKEIDEMIKKYGDDKRMKEILEREREKALEKEAVEKMKGKKK